MRSVLLAVAAVALAGCSTLSGLPVVGGWMSDASKKPAPLPEIRASVTPQVVWSAAIGRARGATFYPGVDGGRVAAAAEDGTITVLEADTGRVLGRHDAKTRLSAGVGAGAGIVVVATPKGDVLAFDPAGKPLWKANVGGEVLAPAVVTTESALVRTGDGRIFAFAVADGKRRWVYQRAAPPLLLRAPTGVAATPTNVVAGYPGGKLLALDLDDGKLTWEVTVSVPRGATELERVADVAGVPVIDAGRICAAAFQGRVACFEIAGGNTVWTRELSSASGLALDGASAYLTDDKDQVHALDKASGASRWKQDKLLRRGLTAPVAFEGKVVVGDALGFLHVLSPDTGELVGRLALDGTAVSALVPVRGGLLAQTAGGQLSLVRF